MATWCWSKLLLDPKELDEKKAIVCEGVADHQSTPDDREHFAHVVGYTGSGPVVVTLKWKDLD